MNSIVKLGLNLFIICAVAALLLGITNQVTEPVIANRNIQSNNESRQIVLPDANEFILVSDDEYKNIDGIISEVYEGKNGSETIGYTIKVIPKGYGGPIELIVGILNDGTISAINIGSMSETPGLGAKASDSNFKDQFKGKQTSELILIKGNTSEKNEVSAISGATITSSAVTDGVNVAIDLFNSYLSK